MKTSLAFVLVSVAFATLNGCSTPGAAQSQFAPTSTDAGMPLTMSASPAAYKMANLYAANSGGNLVAVYDKGENKVLRTIRQGIGEPVALAFDTSGNLYVANDGIDTVTVYAPGKTTVLRTISKGVGGPDALAFDSSGNLYVSNSTAGTSGNGTITVYAPGKTTVLRTITDGIGTPGALAFDDSGDLYVANSRANTVTVYAPGKTRRLYTLSGSDVGLDPNALIFSAHRLFVAAAGGTGSGGEVHVFKELEKHALYAVPDSEPEALAVDSGENLYIGTASLGSSDEGEIDVWKDLGKISWRSITSGVKFPLSLTFDSAGDLYVSNGSAGTITVYAPGKGKILRTIRDEVGAETYGLRFGP